MTVPGMSGLRLAVLTPDASVLDEDVDEVVVPILDGWIGVLRGHAPFQARLLEGEVVFRKGDRERVVVTIGGTIGVTESAVTILTGAAFQIINFIVLLAILARFFYRPLMNAVARRESAIAGQLADATRKADEAESARRETEEARQAATAEGQALVAQARVRATAIIDEATVKAQAEAARIVEAAHQSADRESQRVLHLVEGRLLDTAVSLAESVLSNTTGRSLDDAWLAHLAESWPASTDAAAVTATAEASRGGHPIVVEIARDPTTTQRDLLRAVALRANGIASSEPRLEYEIHPEVLAGARIRAGSIVIDLTLKRMLAELRESAARAER